VVPLTARAADTTSSDFVRLAGGSFLMGTADAKGFTADGEGPVRTVTISPFAIAPAVVTNVEFAAFVAATGYVTDAERFGWSFVFRQFVPVRLARGAAGRGGGGMAVADPWCLLARAGGAGLLDRAAGRSIRWSMSPGTPPPIAPGRASADRGGVGVRRARRPRRAAVSVGDGLTPGGKHRCNIWQGRFPEKNSAADGYVGTAPARAFPPNDYGLYNVVGNVWERCADWFSAVHDDVRSDPQGPDAGTARVIRGGSYLCHRSYCNRYRVAERSANMPDSTSGNTGFRCAAKG